jgi:hypothetical protein
MIINGWYYTLYSDGLKVLSYHCNRCSTETVFGKDDKKPRAFCCGQLKEFKEPKGLLADVFGSELPVISLRSPIAVILPGKDCSATD